MGTTSEPASQQPDERGALRRAGGGDQAAWAQVLALHRKRLRRMVALRLDQRLRGRIDPSDVLQEAFLQAAQALPKYLERPEQSVFLWLRWLTGMTLQLFHRQHLGVQARDVGREVQLLDRPWPEATSAALAALLLGRDTRPSMAAIRAERLRLHEALNAMDPLDRKVLVLRHFEELTNAEVARELGSTKPDSPNLRLRRVSSVQCARRGRWLLEETGACHSIRTAHGPYPRPTERSRPEISSGLPPQHVQGLGAY
jgi:RNA polymerase sigma-70 factor, ECF subfamily